MNLRLRLFALFALLPLCFLSAQTFGPLGGHDALRPTTKLTPATNDKMDCDEPDLSAFERVIVGEQSELRIDLDTAGLGTFVDNVECIGCATAEFGTVALRNDTLTYDPFSQVDQGLDTLRFVACTETGVCTDTLTLIVLVQRPGREIPLDPLTVDPGGRIELPVPDGDLPGGLACRSIAGCAADYPGREQRFAFIGDLAQGNDVSYVAARYGGTDRVCVTLCNSLGLCDTYTTEVTVVREPVSLPFFDDFSYGGSRPAAALWQDEDVLVNDNFAQEPPSIGVATFDAVDFDGRPYPSSGTAFVIRDYLTSAPINMSGQNGAVLSFWIQPRGFGNRPETRDSFLLQFLDQEGNWTTVFGEGGRPNTESNRVPIPFALNSIRIPDAYLYNGFQFRFANKSSERGVVDNWHLDYVKLQNSSSNDRPEVTQDLALVERPFYLTAPYTSVPLRHFQAAEGALFGQEAFFKVYNHRDDITVISDSRLRVRDISGGDFNLIRGLLLPDFFEERNSVPALSLEVREDVVPDLPDFSFLSSYLLQQIDPAEDVRMAVTYDLTVASDEANFSPLVLQNNSATTVTEFGDYLAYDDGTAEQLLEGGNGLRIVQRYELFTDDELTGIRLRIPRGLRNLSGQDIRLLVYAGDGVPEEELGSYDFPILFPEDFYRDSLNGFTSYELPAPLPLTAGVDLFIGWEQLPNDERVGIGYDRRSTAGDLIYFDNGSGWAAFDNSGNPGALMIRPLLSGAAIQPTSTEEEWGDAGLRLFPNPTAGRLTISRIATDGRPLRYRLFSPGGRVLDDGVLGRSLDLSDLPPGLYVLETTAGDRVSRHKIIRR